MKRLFKYVLAMMTLALIVNTTSIYAEEDQKGTLLIRKQINGDISEYEAEDAIKFTVSGPQYGEGKTFNLSDFDKQPDGTYKKELDVCIGEYTVAETSYDIYGKSVTVTYSINSGESQTGTSAVIDVTKGDESIVDFENEYSAQKGTLKIKKEIKGDISEDEALGAIRFTVSGPQYPDGQVFNLTDENVVSNGNTYTISLNNIIIGTYTVEETSNSIDGKNVTVTYRINSEDSQTGNSARIEVTKDETSTVDFENKYSNPKGTLLIRKEIKGDISADEALGAIKFTVSGPQYGGGKTFNLSDFDKQPDGTYKKELDVCIGEYTVAETSYNIDGKNVTVTYCVNSGESQTDTSASLSVSNEETSMVEFKNEYSNQKGTLLIRKKINGEVSADEAKDAIKFTVSGPQYGGGKTFNLSDFDKQPDGTYKKELDVCIGEYTVAETSYNIDGKSVTVTYRINSGVSQTGTSASLSVSNGETSTVDFANKYIIKKTNSSGKQQKSDNQTLIDVSVNNESKTIVTVVDDGNGTIYGDGKELGHKSLINNVKNLIAGATLDNNDNTSDTVDTDDTIDADNTVDTSNTVNTNETSNTSNTDDTVNTVNVVDTSDTVGTSNTDDTNNTNNSAPIGIILITTFIILGVTIFAFRKRLFKINN